MKRKIQAGTTSLRLRIFVQNSSSTVGAGLTGLAWNTAGLTWYYIRDADSADVQVTLATAALGTWTSGGLIVVDGTNMPGVYEIGVPNAAITGSDCVHMMLQGAANMVPVLIEIELDAVNYQSQTAFVTGVNSLAPPTNWNLSSIDGSGRVLLQPTQTGVTIPTVTTVTTVTNQLAASAIATGVWTDTTAGDFTVANSIGKALYIANVAPGGAGGHFIAGTNAATTVTTSFTTTFTGNLTGSVGSVTGAVGSVTGNVGGNVVGSTASVTGAVGSVTGNVGGNVVGSVGSVSGVTFPTNFGSCAIDTSGRVVLQPSGMDAVTVETGLNARQSLSIIAAAVAGVGGTGTGTYDGAGVGTTRITYTASAGTRSVVTLSPPT